MSLPYEHRLIENAKKLRREATRQEKHLWFDYLRSYPVRFQRQKAIGDYIVDFYCHAAKLVVELDGSQHYEDAEKRYDEARTCYLNSLGLKVLRIVNVDVDRHFVAVCEMIDRQVQQTE